MGINLNKYILFIKDKFYFGIKNKLALLISSILFLNIILVLIFGNTFITKYYLEQKENELLTQAEKINKIFNQNDAQSLSDVISQTERKNINILIFKEEINQPTKGFNFIYYSKGINSNTSNSNNSPENIIQSHNNAKNWVLKTYEEKYIDYIKSYKNTILLTSNKSNNEALIGLQIVAFLGNDIYLLMETPKEAIKTSSDIALKFIVLISIITFLVGLFITFIISYKITNPIRKIDRIARKMAYMDFSEKCNINSKDEIGILASNINIMADNLKDNINKLKKVNNVLKRDLEREERSNKLRREFIANVSHDFKTPLSLIMAYSEAIKDNQCSEDEKLEYCNIIEKQSESMSLLVSQLLNLSQYESGVIKLENSFFSINEIINSTLYNHKIILEQKNIKYNFKYKDEFIVSADYNKISQICNNLFENALKYTDDNEVSIQIENCKKENSVKIIFSNHTKNAQNIDLKNIFNSFYKFDKSRGLDNKSHGLGLAVVKAILELHKTSYGVYISDDNIINFWFKLNKQDL